VAKEHRKTKGGRKQKPKRGSRSKTRRTHQKKKGWDRGGSWGPTYDTTVEPPEIGGTAALQNNEVVAITPRRPVADKERHDLQQGEVWIT